MNTDHDVFWLARYTHNQLAPLFEEARTVDPNIRFSIEMRFPNSKHPYGKGSVGVFAHWDLEEGMFLYAPSKYAKADIDQLAETLRAKVDRLKAEVQQDERRIDAALATI